jgi:hypothetical protein
MLERFSYIESLPWPSTSPSHTVLTKLRVPQDLIVNGLTEAPFNNFTFWNGEVKVKFQVIGSPLTQGCAVAFFVPLTDPTFIESNILRNFSSLSVNQAVYLFANANTSAEMDISFNSVQAYLNISDLTTNSIVNTLGYIYVVVFNQLALSTGTPDNVAISIFSQFVNNEFKVPRRTGVARVLRPRLQSSSRVLNGFMKALEPDNVIGDAIDLASSIFGMDNPVDPGVEKSNKLLTTQRMNFGEGIEYIDKLCVDPSKTSEATSDTFATVQDEMDFDVIKKKYTYLGSFNLKTANNPGDILASFPMNPCPNFVDIVNPYQVPLLQYLCQPYAFWKGGLTYKIQVVSTSMQTAKIFTSLNYGEFSPATPGLLVSTSSQYGEAFEVNQGSNTYEFTVPYVSITPELFIPTSNVPTSRNSLGMINISVLNNLVSPNNSPTIITFNIFIAGADDFTLNSLSMGNQVLPHRFPTSEVIPSIKQRVVQEIEYDSDIEIVSMPPTRTFIRNRLQSAAQPLITPMSNVNMSSDNIIAPTTDTAHRIDVGQRRINDIRKLMKKYHMYTHNIVTPAPADKNGYVRVIRIRDLFGYSGIGSSFSATEYPPIPQLWAHYQSLYRQFKGSINFKLMMDNQNSVFSQFSVFYQPPVESQVNSNSVVGNQFYTPTPRFDYDVNGITATTYQSNATGTRLPVTYSNSINRTAEFSVPFTSRYLSLINTQASEFDSADANDMGTLFIYFDKPEAGTSVFNVFFSFGDDSRFGTLFNVPYLIYNLIVDPTTGEGLYPAWPDQYLDTSPVVNTLILL